MSEVNIFHWMLIRLTVLLALLITINVTVNSALTLPSLSYLITRVFQECSKEEGGDKKTYFANVGTISIGI